MDPERFERRSEETGSPRSDAKKLDEPAGDVVFGAFFEFVKDALFILDLEGRILAANREACDRLGYSREAFLDMHIGQIETPEQASLVPQRIEAVRRQGHLLFETDYRTRDGALIAMEISARLFEGAADPLIFVACRDITGRKKAREEVARSEKNLKEAQQIARMGNWELDLVANRLAWSDGVYDLFEMDPKEFGASYEAFLDAIHPEDRELVARAYAESLKKRIPYEISHRLLMKDGRIKWVNEICQTEYDDRGHPVKSFGIIQDITEQREAEAERRRFEIKMRDVQKLESLGLLAGGIAHDFNNLLMAILGNAELAMLSLPPDSEIRRRMDEIVRASHRGADLCRQMLAYSGKGRFVVGRHDLSKIVRGMEKMIDASISKKAVLRYALAEGLPAVEADDTQIRQVIMNLITNASEALGGMTGTISIATGVMAWNDDALSGCDLDQRPPSGKYVYLEIADTGCGLDSEARSKMFDPFYTTKFTGRGLGLPAVQGIVRGHKGAIQVSSAVGRGSTFKILLPAVDRQADGRGKPAGGAGPLAGRGAILLVDDDPDVRKVVTAMLETLGFQVLTAANGREGLECFRTRGDGIACVVLDLTMPEMGGEETFRELRKARGDVRVILSSGYDEQAATRRFAGSGLAGFIQKPYNMANLRKALKHALG